MSDTAGGIFGSITKPTNRPLLKDLAIAGVSTVAGVILNRVTAPKAANPPPLKAPTAPSIPKPPVMATPPDLGTTGTSKKTGRNATILTGPKGLPLGIVGNNNSSGYKTVLGG